MSASTPRESREHSFADAHQAPRSVRRALEGIGHSGQAYARRGRGVATVVACSFCGLLAACGPDKPLQPVEPGITVIAKPGRDTIDALLEAPLVVEVRGDNGALAAGRPVTITTPPLPDFGAEAYLSTTGVAGSFRTQQVVVAGANGRVAVRVMLGRRTSVARVVFSVEGSPGTFVTDTVSLIVDPGAAVAVRAAARDTTVYLGNSLQLRAGAVDRHGNVRNDPVTFQAGPTLIVSPGGVVTPSVIGRSWVVVQAALGVDTGFVSVVPRGSITAVLQRFDGNRVVRFDLDGSRYRVLTPLIPYVGSPSVSPNGDGIAYDTFAGNAQGAEVFVADTAGKIAKLASNALFRNAAQPRYSHDGQWIFIAGQEFDAVFRLWRMRPDGSGLEKLGEDLGQAKVDWYPDPSPDGTLLAFATIVPGADPWVIRTLDLRTRQVSAWNVPGLVPRWNPSSTRFAALAGSGAAIRVFTRDGVLERTIEGNTGEPFGPPTWSPDGKWLAFFQSNTIVLHEIETGLTLPLGWSAFLNPAAWR